jgi:hypothetical protein
MQICTNKKNKLLKNSAYGAIDGFVSVLSEVEPSGVGVGVGVVGFPDASVDDDENNENVFPNIPFPEASVVGAVGFPEASVDDDENNENDSKFGENKSSIFIVPPNNDEIILFIKVYLSNTYYIIIIIKIYFLFIFRI